MGEGTEAELLPGTMFRLFWFSLSLANVHLAFFLTQPPGKGEIQRCSRLPDPITFPSPELEQFWVSTSTQPECSRLQRKLSWTHRPILTLSFSNSLFNMKRPLPYPLFHPKLIRCLSRCGFFCQGSPHLPTRAGGPSSSTQPFYI